MESRELPETSSERKRELQESSTLSIAMAALFSQNFSFWKHVGCDLGAESYLS